MKRILTIGLVVLLVVGALYYVFKPSYYIEKSDINRKTCISYEEVNVREKPHAEGRILGVLQQYEEVTLTGNYCEHNGGGLAEFDKWVEIRYNGTTAWITDEAVR